LSKSSYYAHGKLLLTGEYAVLDGALALAIPTKFGQHMKVKQTRKSDLFWKSYDKERNQWFSAQISLYDFSAVKTTDEAKATYLAKLLKGAVRQNSEFLSKWNGYDVETHLEFERDWGLGSSSTLTQMIAMWADVNPLLLHFEVSNGSGYDVAAAGADLPITYQMSDDSVNYKEVDFDPSFKDKLHFVHLNKKQDSKTAVEHYFKKAKQKKTLVKKISKITESVLTCNSLTGFMDLMAEHEAAISQHLGIETVSKQCDFGDFNGITKSLGAWGGDFILAASPDGEESVASYFKSKGYNTVLPYNEMLLQRNDVGVEMA